MPELSGKRTAALLILYFGVYTLLYEFVLYPLIYYHFGLTACFASDVLVYAAVMLAMIVISGRWLREQWRRFTADLAANLNEAVFTFVKLYLSVIVMNLLIVLPFSLSEAENEVNNNAYMDAFLPGFLISSLLFAPFVEELIFRGCICIPAGRKNFWTGALFSAACFGFLHIGATLLQGNTGNLMYFFVYGVCGFVLALPLRKTGTIFTGMTAHMLYNLLAILLSI